MDESRAAIFSPPKLILIVALAAVVLPCASSSVRAETGAVMIAIDRMTVGSSPDGFTFARTGQGGAAQWTVTADPTATSGRAIEQTSTDRTDYRFPLAIYDAVSATNLSVAVRFRAVAGKIDQAAGIALRLRDADNYYVARANALEDNVRFYRVVKGRREQLQGANLKVTPNDWHVLRLRAEGERFTISYDGKPLFTATDSTFSDAGRVALWTKADSITRFDQIEIEPLP
jgi:hypothetical protein